MSDRSLPHSMNKRTTYRIGAAIGDVIKIAFYIGGAVYFWQGILG